MTEENKNTEPKDIKRKTRIQRFKEKCKGTLKFSFIFFSAIHIAKIVIAAIYFQKCPVEPNIPKYLLILGILGIVTKFITLFRDFLMKHIKVSPILSIIATAELAIFIVASYYTYREYKPSYEPLEIDRYCNKTLYLFSFIYLTIVYCFILFIILVVGCFILCIILLDKYGPKDIDEDMENNTTEVAVSSEHQ